MSRNAEPNLFSGSFFIFYLLYTKKKRKEKKVDNKRSQWRLLQTVVVSVIQDTVLQLLDFCLPHNIFIWKNFFILIFLTLIWMVLATLLITLVRTLVKKFLYMFSRWIISFQTGLGERVKNQSMTTTLFGHWVSFSFRHSAAFVLFFFSLSSTGYFFKEEE